MVKLLDTDTCVEILRGNPRVLSERARDVSEVMTSVISVGELRYGAAKSKRPRRAQRVLDDFLDTIPVAGISLTACDRFGSLKALLESDGRRLDDADLWIASIALANDLSLVTGNLKHFSRIPGLVTEDWIRPVHKRL